MGTGIFSLPNELLVAIVDAARQDDFSDFPYQLSGAHHEWHMSYVSHRFREVIIGAPTLWTFLEVDLILVGSVEIFKLYLERSRGCKIWANLRELSWDRETVEHHLIAERLSHIVPHTNRIQRLSIMSNPESMKAMLAPFRYAEVPNLEYLNFRGGDSGYSKCPLKVFQLGAPKLTFLKMDVTRPYFPVPQWTASLTHLELWSSEDQEDDDGHGFFEAIIAECPLLVHLYMDTLDLKYHNIPAGGICIPTLESLHLLISPHASDADCLLDIVALFDVPSVTDLTIDYAHGNHICVLFNPASLPRTVFPAVTSLSFVGSRCACESETDTRANLQTIPAPPERLFPALSSLTLINVCFMTHIVKDLLGPGSQPWSRLETLTVGRSQGEFDLATSRGVLDEDESAQGQLKALQEVYTAIQHVARWKHQQEQTLPKFRLSPLLFYQDYWKENGLDVELFDPWPIVSALG